MMKVQRSIGSASIDPREHYLVILTRAQLLQPRLNVPIFEIRDGRRCRHIDGSTAEGLRILEKGRNILYVGLPADMERPAGDTRFRTVLVSLQRLEAYADLRDVLPRHLRAFDAAISSAEVA